MAVGPDFIHTFPSFLVLIALLIIFWENPPSFKWIHVVDYNPTPVYKTLQMFFSWVCVNAVLWLWLVFQRVLYCTVWSNWSYDTEYREFIHPWWQRVWSSYYPQPLRPPLLSAGFISWILAMSIAACTLGCAFSIERLRGYLHNTAAEIRDMKITSKIYLASLSTKFREAKASFERTTMVGESEMSSVCEDCRSEISADEKNHVSRQNTVVLPVCNGTDWYSLSIQRNNSLKSMRTSKTITGECPEGEDGSPKILRHRRLCDTVRSTCSDKSSGC